MTDELISVIVPCYNVEKYLEKCVKSILNQTYTNLEIILVDDGATDNTPKICDELALTDSRIKVIHKSNGGLSDARNAGIEIASGKYITFLDSDDWLEKDTINMALQEILSGDFDLVIWSYSADFVDDNENIIRYRLNCLNGVCDSKNNLLLANSGALGLMGYSWNKLYKTSTIKNNALLFEKGVSLIEDILFNSEYIKFCKRIKFIDFVGNHYIQRKRVTLGTAYYENVFELKLRACLARESILKHFCVEKNRITEVMGSFYYEALKSAVFAIILGEGNISQKIQKLQKFLLDSTVQNIIKKVENISIKQRLLFYLIKIKAVYILFCVISILAKRGI